MKKSQSMCVVYIARKDSDKQALQTVHYCQLSVGAVRLSALKILSQCACTGMPCVYEPGMSCVYTYTRMSRVYVCVYALSCYVCVFSDSAWSSISVSCDTIVYALSSN